MKTLQQARLADFRPNQKFTWNGRIYTVFQHQGNMTEVCSEGKFWAWPSVAMVSPVVYGSLND